jgi:hypothetical protein
MIQALGPYGPPLAALIVVTLAVGLPVTIVLAIRFLWYREIHLGRSRQLDKLVWQLHRIASALEHERGLSFPADQPGAERSDARDTAQRPVAGRPAPQAPAVQASAIQAPDAQQPTATPTLTNPPPAAKPAATTISTEEHTRAGVNSMFGF